MDTLLIIALAPAALMVGCAACAGLLYAAACVRDWYDGWQDNRARLRRVDTNARGSNQLTRREARDWRAGK